MALTKLSGNINKIVRYTNDNEKGLVVYFTPGKSEPSLLIGKWKSTETNQTSFVLAPFDRNKGIQYLAPEKHMAGSEINVFAESIENQPPPNFEAKLNGAEDISQSAYHTCIQKLVEYLRSGNAQKIVFSRTETVSLGDAFDIGAFLQSLKEKYPSSFNYLLIHPKYGTWMGASPETLVWGNDNQYKTVALAGTQHVKHNDAWGQKDKREQEIVTSYIRETISTIGEVESLDGPNEIRSGNLRHLKTNIAFRSEKDLITVAKTLHPTPAVAGVPLETAVQYITQHETHDRKLYTGFLGYRDEKGNGEMFVNLRCMQLYKNKAVLYLGGGIVEGSDPAKEWEETCNKAEILKSVFDAPSDALVHDHQ